MRYLVQVLLVIVFFLLPVYMDILRINMFTYIHLGFYSSLPAPILSLAVYAAVIILLLSFFWLKKKAALQIQIAGLLILLIPVIQVITRQWQFHTAWSMISYTLFFLLLILSLILSAKKNLTFKKN